MALPYAAFRSGGYTLLQSIVVVLVPVLLGGILGAMWATWGMWFAE